MPQHECECRRPHTLRRFAALAACALAWAPVWADDADEYWDLRTPGLAEDTNWLTATIAVKGAADASPPGANDWQCRPSEAHPEPVILIHGTWENAYNNWSGLAPILAHHGYCVFALNYGNPTGKAWGNATGDMIASAWEIAAYVARVRRATGAAHVALIGHSQGGAQARYYANLLAPAGEVTKVIALTASNHTTTLSNLAVLGELLGFKDFTLRQLDLAKMPAAVQQATPTSPFYVNLNGFGETRPGIAYTNIASRYDEVVTPWTGAFIEAGPGATVDNIVLQDVCARDLSEHAAVSYSKNVAQIVLNKLDPEHARKIRCHVQTPFIGGTRRLPRPSLPDMDGLGETMNDLRRRFDVKGWP